MKKILIIVMSVIVAGCATSQMENLTPHKENLLKINSSSLNVEFKQPLNVEYCVSDDVGKYIDFLAKTDFISGISASSANPLSETNFRAVNERVSISSTMKSGMELSVRNIIIDGNNIENIFVGTKSYSSAYYGRNVAFGIKSEGKSTKSESEGDIGDVNVEMYIPEVINITWPPVTSEEEIYPLCYYDGLHVKWNADAKNKEGILIVVEWTGLVAYGNHYSDAHVRCLQKVDDTGNAELDNSLFAAIPDTAICYLTLLRGNIENVVIDENVSYKLFGESHQSLPFVLIKNMRSRKI